VHKLKDSEAALRRILATLAPTEREALEMYYVRDFEDVQICSETGMGQSELRELRRRVKKEYSEAKIRSETF
jgi:DNA-directed RNA polymerase specialized sigma24 family protein